MDNEIVRVNLRMSKELKEWFVNNSKVDSIPYSALMVLALREYKKQIEGLASMNEMKSLNDMLKKLEENNG